MDAVTQLLSPAQRITKGLCPECGIPLAGLNASHHAVEHWGDRIPDHPSYEEARKRRRMLEQYGKDQVAGS